MITRYLGQPLPVVVKFPSNPLSVYGGDYDEIEEVRMNLKRNLESDSDDRYIQKSSLNSGVLIDSVDNKFTMILLTTDYTNITANRDYYLTLNVKIPSYSDFIELDIEDRKIRIIPDTNRS